MITWLTRTIVNEGFTQFVSRALDSMEGRLVLLLCVSDMGAAARREDLSTLLGLGNWIHIT